MAKTNREKAEELLSKLSLHEKVGQLILRAGCKLDAQGVPDSFDLVKQFENGEVGSVIQHANDMTDATLFMQHYETEKSDKHIPLFINADMIHGLETVYPTPIAAACSFDPELVEKSAKASAVEARACGVYYTNAPMIDIARDPRWGRVAESQGEDPYLGGEMGKAYVRGFQNKEAYVMATLKHYCGYGACEGGRDYNVCEMNENTMLNTYLIPFREGVKAGASSVMTSFNSIENIPATGNKKYLRKILREKFGFNGIIISDAGSSFEMISHGYCKDLKDCAVKSIEAGLDIDLGSEVYPTQLENAVLEGLVDEKLVDECVLRILEKKFELELFEDPYLNGRDKNVVFCEDHLKLSEELALESAVLFENNGVLPLDKSKKVALIGRFSNSKDMLGCWQESLHINEAVTPYEGFVNNGFNVVACVENYNLKEIKKAVKKADVVLFNFGETSLENGEARSHHNLKASPEVVEAYNFIKKLNKKVVTFVFAGRPLILNEFKNSDALVYCWNLGHMAGNAIAKLFSGEANFSAKTCVTFPTSEGQLPQYYARKKVGRPYDPNNTTWRFQVRYDDGNNEPLYYFGQGLSYSNFVYSNIKIEKDTMKMDEKIKVSIDVKNDSNVSGTEIVQLYINDKVSEVVRPIRELKDFKRVYIKPNEKKTVEFTITLDKLSYYHEDGELRADEGEFEVFIGKDSRCLDMVSFSLVK